MPRKVNINQPKSKLRQVQNKRRQAVNKYNSEARKYNQKVRQRRTKINQAINQYNSAARQHNARVRANRARLNSEIAKLRSSPSSKRYVTYVASSEQLANSYSILEQKEENILGSNVGAEFLDLSEKEAADSIQAANELGGNSEVILSDLSDSEITTELSDISKDLNDRWRGALYALSPDNPDAARHFCTGTREILIEMLNYHAPDNIVKDELPNCEFTGSGEVTRKSKIRHILLSHGVEAAEAADFVDDNVGNILTLFGAFNSATHGAAGKYALPELQTLKTRTESGILYLSRVCSL